MRPFRDDESGAVLVIVALCLFALVGMVVLVVDVGGLLTMRRTMVTAADAAALAAAGSCGRDDAAGAPGMADDFAQANVASATRLVFQATDCGTGASGEVTVKYQAPKDLFFAPLLGAPDSRPVSATATAIWGPAGGISPVPIEFSVDATGKLPCVLQPIGSQCNYWHDNSSDYDLGNSSSWGFMNLNEWDVDPEASCSSAGTDERREWITGDLLSNVIIQNSPAYVCVDTGHSTSSWYDALSSQIGRIKYFPINDPDAMILSPAGKAKWAVIGFAALKIDAVLKGNDPEAVGIPGSTGNCTTTNSFTAGSELDLDMLPACYPAGPDDITNLVLSTKKNGKTTIYQPDLDYEFDADTHVVTWLVDAVPDVKVAFDWANEDTPGKCGFHDPDPNGVCIVASWQGAQVGGSLPGGGQDFGLRAVRLTE
ncbi:MAG: pilus assembly protein TadG-related protein [Actinomycetota bacterium]